MCSSHDNGNFTVRYNPIKAIGAKSMKKVAFQWCFGVKFSAVVC